MHIYREALAAVEPRDTFMPRLRQTLELHSITHASLAWHAGICPTQLSRWMRGRAEPNLESMLMLDEALQKVLYGGG